MHRVTRLFLENIQNLGFTIYHVVNDSFLFHVKGYRVVFSYIERIGVICFMFNERPYRPYPSEVVFKDWGMAEHFIQKNCFLVNNC